MAATSYDEALRRLLVHEGGYTDHPSDPGGPTNFGITIHDYRKHVKPDATAADVRAMPLDRAKAIYRSQYWDVLRCDELPGGIDYAVFDYGVNSGVGRSGKVLRRVLQLDDLSHRVTDAVIAAAKARSAAGVVTAICDERLAFLKRLKTWPVFGPGWSRRVAQVRRAALAMTKARPAAIGEGGAAAGKGAVASGGLAQRSTAAATVVAGAAAAHQAHQSGAGPLIVFAIVVAAVAIAWAGWRWWRRRQERQQEG